MGPPAHLLRAGPQPRLRFAVAPLATAPSPSVRTGTLFVMREPR
jgi:hypothetical protein